MSYYPPVGKELEVLKKIDEYPVPKVKDDLEEYAGEFARDNVWPRERDEISSWNVDFALRGVRCNGHEDTTTLADFILGCRRIRDALPEQRRKIVACMDYLEVFIYEILDLCKDFEICPKCKGQKGKNVEKVQDRIIDYSQRWQDCETCLGRGVLLRESSI